MASAVTTSGPAAMDAEILNRIAEYFLAGHMGCDEETPIMKYASGLYNTYKHVPILIDEGADLAPVGRMFRSAYCKVICNGSVELEDPLAEAKKLKYDDERVTAVIQRSKEYWREYDVLEALKSTFNDEDKAIFAVNDVGRYQYFFSTWQGHATLDYRGILAGGLAGYKSRIDEKLRSLDSSLPDHDKKREFYRALQIVMEGIELLVRRYADECERLSRELAPGDAGLARLQRLAGFFRNVLTGAPRDFFAAVECLHFFYVFDGWDNAGRIDQLLCPFYEKDLKAGKVDEKRAEELLYQLFHLWGQGGCWNMRIGGQKADGSDAANDLTRIVMNARKRVHLPKPSLSFSVTSTTPDELLKKAFEVMRAGVGQPALYNDELYVNTLESMGAPRADAVEYSFGGCTETHIAGKGSIRDSFVSVAKCLELVLYNGRVSKGGEKFGPQTGDPAGFRNFAEFFSAYKRQVEYLIYTFVNYRNRIQEITARLQPALFRSIFVEASIEKGLSNSEGGAVYNHGLVDVFGIPNTANSLFAIKKLVYDDKRLSMGQLIEALDKNFEGFEDIRRLCRAQHKYGNDCDDVDEIAREVADHVFRYIQKHKIWKGGIYYAFCASNFHGSFGQSTGATPDGRLAGTPLADSMGPVQGTDTHGPTAMINSVTKLDLSAAIGTPVVNIRFTRQHFDEGQDDNLVALVRTYLKRGGMQLQFNIINRDTLFDAIEHPENYGDLIVRVAGYCDYFNNLPLELRKEMAERTAH